MVARGAGVRQSREESRGVMAGSRKKVIVRMNDLAVQAGYLPACGFLNRASGTVELLDAGGRIVEIPMNAIRYVAYVRDFNLDDEENPERLLRRAFMARPRTEGLWVRLTFADGEVLEGLAGLDASLLEDAVVDGGVYLIPPDVRSNTQRIFVPRGSIAGMVVVGVITTPSKAAAPAPAKKRYEGELDLPFPDMG